MDFFAYRNIKDSVRVETALEYRNIKIESNESNTNITNYNFRLLSINKQSIIHHKIDDGIDIDIDNDDDDNDEDNDDENPE